MRKTNTATVAATPTNRGGNTKRSRRREVAKPPPDPAKPDAAIEAPLTPASIQESVAPESASMAH